MSDNIIIIPKAFYLKFCSFLLFVYLRMSFGLCGIRNVWTAANSSMAREAILPACLSVFSGSPVLNNNI